MNLVTRRMHGHTVELMLASISSGTVRQLFAISPKLDQSNCKKKKKCPDLITYLCA